MENPRFTLVSLTPVPLPVTPINPEGLFGLILLISHFPGRGRVVDNLSFPKLTLKILLVEEAANTFCKEPFTLRRSCGLCCNYAAIFFTKKKPYNRT